MRDVARELTRAVGGDGFRRIARIIENLDLARLNDEELEGAIADRDEHLAVRAMSRRNRGAFRQLRDLVIIENREGDGVERMFGHNYSAVRDLRT